MQRFLALLTLLLGCSQPVIASGLADSAWSRTVLLELGNDFFVRDLRELPAGELLVAGDQLILPPVTDGGPEPISYNYVQLHEADGSLRWQVVFPGSGRSMEYGDIALNASGTEVFLTGQVKHGQPGLRDLFAAKLSIDGEVNWQLEFSGDADLNGRAVAADGAGGAFVAGLYSSREQRGQGGLLLRIDRDGEIVWTVQLPPLPVNALTRLAVHPDGSVTAAGEATGAVAGQQHGQHDTIMVTYSPSGELLWQLQFGTPAGTQPLELLADDHGLLLMGVVNGALFDSESAADDVYVARFSFAGELLWGRQFGGNDNDRPLALASGGPDSAYAAALFASYADAYAPVETQLGLVQVDAGTTIQPGGSKFDGAVGGSTIAQRELGPVLLLAMNEGAGWLLHEFNPGLTPAGN